MTWLEIETKIKIKESEVSRFRENIKGKADCVGDYKIGGKNSQRLKNARRNI